ncbi:MAG: outer membrane beta-barrel protein [Bacteroidota bacterium]
MKKLTLYLLLSLFTASLAVAQNDSTKHKLTISGYTDVYFAAFSDSLGANALQQFTTVSPRAQRFGVNTAQIGAHYESDRIRGNFIIHYGDIAKATWSTEFPFLQEANVGFRITEGLWLDAGFFATHIGTESFLPKNNYTSSTALATFNEPFFQSGARLQYSPSDKFTGEFWVVSGYNFFLDANDAKSVGVLLNYEFSDNLSLTYTNLFGRESLDDVSPTQFRTYHNLYLNATARSFDFVLGGDFGTQSNSKNLAPEETAVIYNALAVVRRRWDDAFSTTIRGEVFSDEEGFISGIVGTPQGSPEGLQAWGLTLSNEYRTMENAYIRLEGRYLQTPDNLPIFYDGESTNQRWEFMVTMGIEFEQKVR